jgi:DNA-binding response OmpR family regulator
MRCLFVIDEIARFREVAVVLDSSDVAMLMVKEFALAERLANTGGFDVLIVGTNTLASDSMRFLTRRRTRRCPVVAVTCESDLRRVLLEAGADHVVLLPDDGDHLKRAFAAVLGQPVVMPARSGKRSRLWQHFAL